MHLQLNGNVRILLAEQSDHPWHQIRARRLTGTHDQGSTLEVVQIIERATGFVALAEDPIAVTEQEMPGLRELGLATASIKQRDLKLLLKVLDLKTDRRLRHVQAVCRLLEAAFTDDGAQNPQLIEGERQISHRSIAGEDFKI